jgi:hypothetical protein
LDPIAFAMKVWGMGSGCSPFYNTDKEGVANTNMVRYFDEDRFEIFATRTLNTFEAVLVALNNHLLSWCMYIGGA